MKMCAALPREWTAPPAGPKQSDTCAAVTAFVEQVDADCRELAKKMPMGTFGGGFGVYPTAHRPTNRLESCRGLQLQVLGKDVPQGFGLGERRPAPASKRGAPCLVCGRTQLRLSLPATLDIHVALPLAEGSGGTRSPPLAGGAHTCRVPRGGKRAAERELHGGGHPAPSSHGSSAWQRCCFARCRHCRFVDFQGLTSSVSWVCSTVLLVRSTRVRCQRHLPSARATLGPPTRLWKTHAATNRNRNLLVVLRA